MQVTRRRRTTQKTSRRFAAAGAAAVLLVGAGATYASTEIFGHNQVGTQYANGLQVSDDQLLQPYGDRVMTQFGKFMGSTTSPDGHYLAATSTDKSVSLQIFDLESYKLIWTAGSASGVNQKLTSNSVGQEGPTYSPDGKFLWVGQQDAITRFPVNADGTLGTPTSFPVAKVNGHSALVGQIKYSPDGATVYAAINGQNTVRALDPASGAVKQTWNVGIAPRELSFAGSKLYVSDEGGRPAQPGDTTMDSYGTAVPADGYKGTSATVATVGNQVVVTNTRGIDARGPALTFNKGPGTVSAVGHGTHSTTASLTRFALPSDKDIAKATDTVFQQNGWTKNDVEEAKGNKQHAVPVPSRIGDPSTIKHVFLLVKENRTYDQVYGDMSQGNGDSSLAQFGAKVTPNQHALAQQFGLYDNTYDVGTNSAEGHNWLMQGDNPEYTESSAGEYQRSYDTEEDVLGHQRSGFLWTAAEDAGATARNYGEFEYTEGKPAGGTWQQYYCAAKSGDPAQLYAPNLKGNYGSVIPSLDAIADRQSPPFDTSIPDIYRYQVWKQDFEQNGPAGLNMMWLSSDHTGGTADPEAQVADGDLAVGKIVDEISHSKYWSSSAIFVVEDDSQDGADHVDGHRAPIQIISPWAAHGVVDDTYYSQITMVRTIEQILGAQPLNAKVAAATPMYGAFNKKPDMTPFTAVPNQVPLTEGVAVAPACGNDTVAQTRAQAASLKAKIAKGLAIPLKMKATAAAWQSWLAKQRTSGPGAVPDYANPEQMNRYTWYQTHDWKTPYPGDHGIYLPTKVPGAYIPSSDTR